MARRSGIIILFLFLFLCSGDFSVFAQFEDSEKCKNNLTFDSIDFNRPIAKQLRPSLTNFLLCTAAKREDRRICSGSNSPSSCYEAYDIDVNCYSNLIRKGATPQVVSLCSKAMSGSINRRQTEAFLDAVSQKNPDACAVFTKEEDNKFCKALASRNITLCSTRDCSDILNLFLAIEQNRSSYCTTINSRNRRAICLGLTNGRCEDADGYDLFKNNYCNDLCKR